MSFKEENRWHNFKSPIESPTNWRAELPKLPLGWALGENLCFKPPFFFSLPSPPSHQTLHFPPLIRHHVWAAGRAHRQNSQWWHRESRVMPWLPLPTRCFPAVPSHPLVLQPLSLRGSRSCQQGSGTPLAYWALCLNNATKKEFKGFFFFLGSEASSKYDQSLP